MEVSARSYLTAGVSLTAATAIAFMPLAVQANQVPAQIPRIAVSNVQLAATQADVEALIANLQTALDAKTAGAAHVAGIPGAALTDAVGNLVNAIDVVFSRAIAANDDPDQIASLTILKEFTYDAFAMLHHNLGRINTVITTTTAEVGGLLSTALTGSLQNVLVAAVNIVNDPLDVANYAGLLTATVASGQLIAGNGLEAIHSVGEGGGDIVGIANDELTFQFHNAETRLTELANQLADAYGGNLVKTVVGEVGGRSVAPAQTVATLDSGTVATIRVKSLDRVSAFGLQRFPLILRSGVDARPLVKTEGRNGLHLTPPGVVASARHASAGTLSTKIQAVRDKIAANADTTHDNAERPGRHRR